MLETFAEGKTRDN